ncbi:hypothetical protein BGY98DRAFT_935980 [Russula aff. rugulosa BPL654]|nr:hypothetical protein BGY98DRAFT_935980 [Russula aff. rugulosa BPL654]
MQWFMIAFWIFLTLSVSHFALAAPVAVGKIVEVRSNPVEVLNVLNDAMARWEKRMDPNNKDQPSTNDVHLPDGVSGPGDAPGVVQEGVDPEGVKERGVSGWGWDPNKFPEVPSNLEELLWSIKEPEAEGVKEEGVSGWEWDPKKSPEVPSNLEELLWSIKEPDSEGVKEEGGSEREWSPNKFPELPSSLEELLWFKGPDAEGVKEEGGSGWGWDPNKFPELPSNLEELLWGIKGPDASHDNSPNDPPKEESGGGDHAMESSQGLAENISPGPQPEHPATPDSDLTTPLKEWLKRPRRPKVFRPRNSGSGTVGRLGLVRPPPVAYTVRISLSTAYGFMTSSITRRWNEIMNGPQNVVNELNLVFPTYVVLRWCWNHRWGMAKLGGH